MLFYLFIVILFMLQSLSKSISSTGFTRIFTFSNISSIKLLGFATIIWYSCQAIKCEICGTDTAFSLHHLQTTVAVYKTQASKKKRSKCYLHNADRGEQRKNWTVYTNSRCSYPKSYYSRHFHTVLQRPLQIWMLSLPQSSRAGVQEDYTGAGMDKALQECKADKVDAAFLPCRSISVAQAVISVSKRKEMREQKGRMENKNGRQVLIQKWSMTTN